MQHYVNGSGYETIRDSILKSTKAGDEHHWLLATQRNLSKPQRCNCYYHAIDMYKLMRATARALQARSPPILAQLDSG